MNAGAAATGTGSSRIGPRVGLALMSDPAFQAATAPLFARGLVDVVEWSFDTCWRPSDRPGWLHEHLAAFGARGDLLGHGVTLNPLGAGDDERQRLWLDRCRDECRSHRYTRVSEHFGVLRARGWGDGAPLPPPPTAATIAVGRDLLARLADACGAAVGLENLALALGRVDVEREGALLDALLAPVDGFIVLDVHNLWCRSVNFELPFERLLDSYPLARVRELHVSGGSWQETAGARIRRDTHDDDVPEDLFWLVERTLARCPNVDAVILERIGSTLAGDAAAERFRADFERLIGACAAETRH